MNFFFSFLCLYKCHFTSILTSSFVKNPQSTNNSCGISFQWYTVCVGFVFYNLQVIFWFEEAFSFVKSDGDDGGEIGPFSRQSVLNMYITFNIMKRNNTRHNHMRESWWNRTKKTYVGFLGLRSTESKKLWGRNPIECTTVFFSDSNLSSVFIPIPMHEPTLHYG